MVSRQAMDIETGSSRGTSNLSKFSLLGQQFTQFESAIAQGPAYCQPSLGNSGHNNMNIDLGGSFEDIHQPQPQPQLQTQGYSLGYDGHDLNMNIGQRSDLSGSNGLSPQVLLSTLSLLQQKITELQSLVQLIVQDEAKPCQSSSENFSRQQVVASSVQSIISQLVAAAAVMLPSSQRPIFNMLGMNGLSDQLQLGHLVGSGQGLGRDSFSRGGMSGSNNNSVRVNRFNSADSGSGSTENIALQSQSFMKASTATNDGKVSGVANNGTSQFGDTLVSEAGVGEDNDLSGNSKDDEEDGEGESLSPGSYQLVEMEAKEILAEHTHFCEICNKGFKRDANLRMHMRGHGDEYKTPAALARPDKPQDSGPSPQRRYSCPFVGCKRNKEHKKFQPLKTMLCVKNHYRRSHCPKMYTCNRCKIKKFSVVADLKTHEKHCGRDKWQCSCGTTFSRKDKLFGHIALFQGHTPAFTSTDTDGSTPEQIGNNSGGSSSGNGIAVSTFANSCGNSSIVGPPYNTANVTPPIGNVLETGTGVSLGQLAMKNISFSQEGNAHNMELGSSNSLPAFSGNLMQGTFMLQSLLSNNFLQSGGN